MIKCDINATSASSQANNSTILDIPFHVEDFEALAESIGGDESAYLLMHLRASCKTSWFKKKGKKFIARIRNELSEEVLLPRKRLDHDLRILSSLSCISVSNHYFKNVRQTHIQVHDFKEPYFVLGVVKQAIRKFGSLKKALFFFRLAYRLQNTDIEIDGVKYITLMRDELSELAKVGLSSIDDIMNEFVKMGALSRKLAVWNKHLQWHYTIPKSGEDLFWEAECENTYPQPNVQKQSRRPLKLATCYNIVNKQKDKKDNTAPNSARLAHAKEKSMWEWRAWNTQKLMEKLSEHKKYISSPKEQMSWSIFSIQKRIRERGMSFNHALNVEMKIIRSGKYGKPNQFDDREIQDYISHNNTVIYNAKTTELIETATHCNRLNSEQHLGDIMDQSFAEALSKTEDNHIKYLEGRIRQNEVRIPYEINAALRALLERQVKDWRCEIFDLRRTGDNI